MSLPQYSKEQCLTSYSPPISFWHRLTRLFTLGLPPAFTAQTPRNEHAKATRATAVGRAVPKYYYDQATLTKALLGMWDTSHQNFDRIAKLHENVHVSGRYTALPIERYAQPRSFKDNNDAYIEVAVELGAAAINEALRKAGLKASDIDHIFFVSITGIATPSIDARLVNTLGLRSDIKRTPIFGLGCVAGVAGVARVPDYLEAYLDHIAVLVSVELCTLTFQQQDFSIPNIIASGLFGDGAAAVLIAGANRLATGPQIIDTRSIFYSNTEDAMDWNVTSNGFGIVLSPDVPKIVESNIATNVQEFLAANQLTQADIAFYVCHPGGPKVLQAFESALDLAPHALDVTRRHLAEYGNLSSASVLMVLEDTMALLAQHRPPAGSSRLMMAVGPGFCAELVLLRW
ncbi:hypothetical protein LTR09_000096 [Extremus antarcticus]|uniref:Type III polyketide synthase n=1 Tax=Extremus antarcticus TaxID=702011 RepID=A0AAJ0GJ08_9PEZI|nr:hypothetical protein LTR09_000096 [Extremus antarcticus]